MKTILTSLKTKEITTPQLKTQNRLRVVVKVASKPF
jgi:hypothetical protein